jgi:hypothetical protein
LNLLGTPSACQGWSKSREIICNSGDCDISTNVSGGCAWFTYLLLAVANLKEINIFEPDFINDFPYTQLFYALATALLNLFMSG